mmetsp:Transcript_74170/g.197785  ORF Transcript_74170/g.197785 Transcript_74170/m.197785 type:complete len:87 (+) Transcript_74170:690-950(+)
MSRGVAVGSVSAAEESGIERSCSPTWRSGKRDKHDFARGVAAREMHVVKRRTAGALVIWRTSNCHYFTDNWTPSNIERDLLPSAFV